MMWKFLFLVLFLLPIVGCAQLIYKLFREKQSNELFHQFYSGLCGGFVYAFVYSRLEYHFLEIYLFLLLAILIKAIFMKDEGPKVKSRKYFFAALTLLGTFYVLVKEYQVLPSNGYSIGTPILADRNEKLLVAKGGNSIIFNHHMNNVRERWALDIAHKIGYQEFLGMLHGDNSGFRVFGQSIIAACEGKVLNRSDDLEDQQPGVMNTELPLGNFIEIGCVGPEGKRLSFRYAHLKQGSQKVEVGSEVKPGDIIAQVGNTGNTSWPHLHIDIMDDQTQAGVPIFINGRFLRSGELIP